MQRTATANNIVLGMGVIKIDNNPIGLTRDGATFSVEYENRLIQADGDRGGVKGRIVRDGAIPKLTVNHLELLTSFDKMHSGVSVAGADANKTIKGTGKITDSDYHNVEWVGETKGGKTITIKIKNAINLENIEFDLKDKDEVIDTVTFQGTYEENATDEYDELWEISYTA